MTCTHFEKPSVGNLRSGFGMTPNPPWCSNLIAWGVSGNEAQNLEGPQSKAKMQRHGILWIFPLLRCLGMEWHGKGLWKPQLPWALLLIFALWKKRKHISVMKKRNSCIRKIVRLNEEEKNKNVHMLLGSRIHGTNMNWYHCRQIGLLVKSTSINKTLIKIIYCTCGEGKLANCIVDWLIT